MDRPLRLVASNPVEELARTIEALLVIASLPLSEEELADATQDDPERVSDALELLAERYREGRSGIVLEHVAGGFAFRASRAAAEACARLFERPVESRAGRAHTEPRQSPRPRRTRPEITGIRHGGDRHAGQGAAATRSGAIVTSGRRTDEPIFGLVRRRARATTTSTIVEVTGPAKAQDGLSPLGVL